MKLKITLPLLIITLLISTKSYSQIIDFNDAKFKSVLVSNGEINTNGDDEIQVAEAQAFSGKLDLGGSNIIDLTGIEHFISIIELDCSSNKLENLDVSQNIALERLSCYFNSLKNFNLGNNEALRFVFCDGNLFSTLIIDHDYLDTFICRHNEIPMSFDLKKATSLVYFDCNDNRLSSLDVSNIPSLKKLYCDVNLLTELDLSNNLELEYLNCKINPLPSIDLTNNLKLKNLRCSNTELKWLDLSQNIELEELIVGFSKLASLDVSKNVNLTWLDCYGSALRTLNVKNTNNTNIEYFDARDCTDLECIQVDDLNYSTLNWLKKPPNTVFSESCGGTTSVKDISTSSIQYIAYPNPVSQKLIIELEEIYNQIDIEVYDCLGKRHLAKRFNNKSKIELILEGKPGVFFAKVKTEKGEFQFSLIKQ